MKRIPWIVALSLIALPAYAQTIGGGGGGTSGGGGGGTVTQGPAGSSNWLVLDGTLNTVTGTTADSAYAGSGNATLDAILKGIYTRLGTITLGAGSAAIGTVGVTSLPAIPAGSNAIGSVIVTSLPSLPAGSNNIGTVSVTGGAGSTGTDYSVNTCTPPGTATTLSCGGTTYNLLTTIPVNSGNTRKSAEVQNLTGSEVFLVFDDGANTTASLGILPLDPSGLGAFHQGGDWQSTIEQGRIRVFGVAGTNVFARTN